MLAAIEGPDILIVLAVVLLLFGSTQIPKLARSLGSASREFKHGQETGHGADPADTAAPVTVVSATAVPVPAMVVPTPEANGSAPSASIPVR